MRCSYFLLLAGVASGVFFNLYADGNISSPAESIHDQRLAQEANALINPSPMQTVSSNLIAPINTPPNTPVAGGSAPVVTPSKTATVMKSDAKSETGVMGYYDALINHCQKGVFNFGNPAYIGTGKKISMTASINGFQGGYCVVNIAFSNQASRINCLFSSQDLLALKDPKARAAFNNSYAQGQLDSASKTPYDKIVVNACQMS